MDKIYLVKPDGGRKLLASTDIAKSMSYHKLDMAINSAGSMEVDFPPGNKKLKDINFLLDEITFERNGMEIFRGCPSGDSSDFLMTGGLRVTGMLGYLGNAYIPPYEYKGSVKGYVQLLLDAYNKNCGKKRPISLGTVTVTDPNDVIVRSDSGYRNVLELVQEKLVGLLGGYVSVTMRDGVRTLDYLEEPPQSGQSIKYGKNLLDISQDTEYQTVYTVLIPIGATTTNDDGTTAFVDITSVNGGIYYIYDANAVEKYGWREKYIQFEDITIPSNLLNKAKAYLSTLLSPVKSMTVKAIDLALYSGDEPFLPGRKVLVKSAYNNVDTSLTISSVTMFALEPEEEVIEIGASVSTYTEQAASNASSVAAEFINLKLNSLNVDSADIRYLKTVNLEAEVAKLGYVKADVIEANYIKTINLEAEVAKFGYVTANTVEAQYARLDKANIGTGWIDSAMIGEGVVGTVQIADGSITDAKIVELTANKITAGTLSVERLEIRGTANSIVYALNNITGALQAQNVDTLNGEILTPRSITADRIVAGAITAKEIAAGAITANHILAGAITADKLDVRDLSAISAKIGGWELLDGVIRAQSGGKYCGIGREGIAYAFFAGGTASNGSNGVFRVGHDGSLVATNAAITGNITATTLLVQQSIHSETTTIIDTTGTINYKNILSTNANGGYNSYLGIYAESDQYTGSGAVDRAKITFALNDIRAYNGAREADINLYASGYIRISADEQVVINDCTFNGSVTFANGTWNLVGDDVYIGDHNVGGALCIKSSMSNYPTGIVFYAPDESSTGHLYYAAPNCTFQTNCGLNLPSFDAGQVCQLRLSWAGTSVIFRYDGSDFYIMPSDGDTGTSGWSCVPFAIGRTGVVSIMGPSMVLNNGVVLCTKGTDGVSRSAVVCSPSNNFLFGNGGYTESFGSTYYSGNTVYLRANTHLYRNLSWEQSSDVRLKHNITDLPEELLQAYMDIKPVHFLWNDNPNLGVQTGVIAQQVLEAFEKNNVSNTDHNIVSLSEDTETYGYQIYTVNYDFLNTITMAVVQRHEKRIKELESELERLKSMVA